jgi:multidrug resistance efflux pump
LKIKEGDLVQAGQTLADRTQERQQLEEKRQLLELNLKRISSPVSKPPPPLKLPELPKMPNADYSSQKSAIKSAELNLAIAKAAVAAQQNLIETLINEGIPQTSDAIAHEKAKLTIAQMKEQQSIASLESAKASLESAKSVRAYDEYRHSLEQQKRLLDLQQQNIAWQRSQSQYTNAVREQEAAILAATIQIEGINDKMQELSAVTSPFNGTIRRIKYEAQSDRIIRAIAILDVSPPSDGGGSAAYKPGSTGSPNLAMLQSIRAVR